MSERIKIVSVRAHSQDEELEERLSGWLEEGWSLRFVMLTDSGGITYLTHYFFKETS